MVAFHHCLPTNWGGAQHAPSRMLHAMRKRVVTYECPLPLAAVACDSTNKLACTQNSVRDWLLGFYLIANSIATLKFELPLSCVLSVTARRGFYEGGAA